MGTRHARRLAALVAGAVALATIVAAPPASAGPEGYTLTNSWDAAADADVATAPDGTLWAVDGSSTLNHFTTTGTLLSSFTLDGFSFAQGIAVGPDGTLYITDSTTASPSVFAFSPDGTALRGYSLTDGGVALGVDVAPTGEVLVTNASTDRVEVFTPSGTWLRNIGSSGAGPGQLDRPDDVVVGADGTVFVSDYSNDRIQRFTLGGAYLGGFGQPGQGPGQMSRPYAVDLTPAGNVIVFDKSAIQEFAPDGTFVSRTNHGHTLLSDSQGMSVDAAGAIYTTRLSGLARFAPTVPTPPPGTPTPPGPNPPPTPKSGTIALAERKVPVVGKRGTLTLTCKGGGTCQGTATLRSTAKKPARLASATYSLDPGTAAVKVKLTKKGRALLRRSRTVSVKVTLAPRPSGKPVTVKAKLVRRKG